MTTIPSQIIWSLFASLYALGLAEQFARDNMIFHILDKQEELYEAENPLEAIEGSQKSTIVSILRIFSFISLCHAIFNLVFYYH